ncbi:Gfo/Idh/MocA family oxidoreductase [bacterium]|nr:Gfo/Idh/MocA family oxidoreductase [bacterium]
MNTNQRAGKTFSFAVIGYGPSFNMAPQHIDAILRHPAFRLTAVCDTSKERLAAAREAYPHITTFTSADTMLKRTDLDLAVIITPHNTHAPLALKCLRAGLHVVVEKPLAITTGEVRQMLAAARAKKRMLSTFHNRRWDNDYLVLRDILASGVIGDVFRIEAGCNGYHKQRDWWRSSKAVSGGSIYDWGAHFTDWILSLVPAKITSVTGFQAKHPAWKDYTNEDHSEYSLQFDNGCLATLTMSNLSAIDRPRWVLRGTNGSITAAQKSFVVKQYKDGRLWTTEYPFDNAKSDWHAYYRNVCAHLASGEPLVITADASARVIGVLHAADVSAHKGGAPVIPFIR